MTERLVDPGSSASKFRTSARWFFLLLLATSAIVTLSACSGGSSTATTVASISITPTAITVPINTQTDFTAEVKLNDSTVTTTTTVTWEVNGIAGGNTTVGTIVPSSIDALVGIYTAPAAVPTISSGSGEQLGQVNVTAITNQTTGGTSTTGTITSNTAIVTVGVGLGFEITPTAVVVPAGGNQQFSAILNSVADSGATWTVTSASGGNIGTIDATGLYTAPLSPPPGNVVTVTAHDSAAPAPVSATVTIVYSDHSLSGPYAFSWTGNDQLGFMAVAGSFVADGQGRIISGVEDSASSLSGIATQIAISNSSTYQIGSDGRGTATIITARGTVKWYFALTTNQHARMILAGSNATAGGTIDEQDIEALSNSAQAIQGPYVFQASGSDKTFKPMAMAGEFSADGSGNIPDTDTILDVNDDGIAGSSGIVTGDTSLQGSYQFDSSFPGTGRGTLTLTTSTSQRQFAFYAVNSTTASPLHVIHLHMVEIDSGAGNSLLAGDVFSSPTGNSFSTASLVAGNYVFNAGGNTTAGAYAAGGVFISNAAGSITGGVLDANSAGTYNNGPSLSSCAYSVDPTTGRIDLKLFTSTGACPATPSSSVSEFAVYQTAENSAVMLEIDTNAVSSGIAYKQCTSTTAGCPSGALSLGAGSLAVGLIGQGIFHNAPASYQQNLEGQIGLASAIAPTGNLDIDTYSALFSPDPVSVVAIGAPSASGRGTLVITATSPAGPYNLIYYLIDDNTALLFDQDKTLILTGMAARQF